MCVRRGGCTRVYKCVHVCMRVCSWGLRQGNRQLPNEYTHAVNFLVHCSFQKMATLLV